MFKRFIKSIAHAASSTQGVFMQGYTFGADMFLVQVDLCSQALYVVWLAPTFLMMV